MQVRLKIDYRTPRRKAISFNMQVAQGTAALLGPRTRQPGHRPAFPATQLTRAAAAYKPAPGHWLAFLERSGADRARSVHVGASLFHDVAPATELGVPVVWVNRLGETSELPRAAELPDLSGLPPVLDEIVPAS